MGLPAPLLARPEAAPAPTARERLRALAVAVVTSRLVRFGLVGASGIVVHNAVMVGTVRASGLHYLIGAVVATQVATCWNFALSERFVFGDRRPSRPVWLRLGEFLAMNNAVLAVHGPLLVALTAGLGLHYAVSNLLVLVLLALARFALADKLIWRGAGSRRGAAPAPSDARVLAAADPSGSARS